MGESGVDASSRGDSPEHNRSISYLNYWNMHSTQSSQDFTNQPFMGQSQLPGNFGNPPSPFVNHNQQFGSLGQAVAQQFNLHVTEESRESSSSMAGSDHGKKLQGFYA